MSTTVKFKSGEKTTRAPLDVKMTSRAAPPSSDGAPPTSDGETAPAASPAPAPKKASSKKTASKKGG